MAQEKPNPRELLMRWLSDWVTTRKRRLPPPCPEDFNACITWWLDHMQEPEKSGETHHGAVIGGQTRWVEGYAVRCGYALLQFLDLSAADRKLVVAGINDGVPYRGDSGERYAAIYEETMRQRKVGMPDYAIQSLAKMKSQMAKMTVRKTGSSQ